MSCFYCHPRVAPTRRAKSATSLPLEGEGSGEGDNKKKNDMKDGGLEGGELMSDVTMRDESIIVIAAKAAILTIRVKMLRVKIPAYAGMTDNTVILDL